MATIRDISFHRQNLALKSSAHSLSACRHHVKPFIPNPCFGAQSQASLAKSSQEQDEIEQLRRQYHINPDSIPVVSSSGVTLSRQERRQIVNKLMEAHLLALKSRMLGNYSGDHYASNLQLENGTWGLAANIEMAYDDRHFCGERAALQSAIGNALQQLPLNTSNPISERQKAGFKVKALVLTNSNPLDENNNDTPCADCLHWFESNQFFSPETDIISLRKVPDSGTYYLYVRKLTELLPFWGQRQVSLPNGRIQDLPLKITPLARAVMTRQHLNEPKLITLMEHAKSRYEKEAGANLSGRDTAAAILLDNGQISTAKGIDFSRHRRYIPPDLSAAIQPYLDECHPEGKGDPKETRPKIIAIGYYGSDADTPSYASLGYLAQPFLGGPETLVCTLEKSQLLVRTIRDFMPFTYQ